MCFDHYTLEFQLSECYNCCKILILSYGNFFASLKIADERYFDLHINKLHQSTFWNYLIDFWNKTCKQLSNIFMRKNRLFPNMLPCPGGSVVRVSDSWPGVCEFDPQLRRTFFLAYFCLSPLQKHVRKVVGSIGKKSCVSTGLRKPGNTCASPTVMIWL